MKRSESIIFRVTAKEKALIEDNAKKHDLSISEFLRQTSINTRDIEITISHKKIENQFLDFETILKNN